MRKVLLTSTRARCMVPRTVRWVTIQITFSGTGAWTAWATQNVTVTLNNNANNVIRFESTGQDLANIDQIEIL